MPTSKKPTILVVDDNPENIEIITDYLSDDCTIVGVENGQACLDIVGECKPDLILMDLMMPVMDGNEALKKLKSSEKTLGIPVIAVTAQTMTQNFKETLTLGAADYITKPFTEQRLKQAIKGLLQDESLLPDRELMGLNNGSVAINLYENAAVLNFYDEDEMSDECLHWVLTSLNENFVTPIDIIINRNAANLVALNAFSRVINETSYGEFKNMINKVAYVGELNALEKQSAQGDFLFLKEKELNFFSKIKETKSWFLKNNK